ncbi:uncharacterized protein LOC117110158 [Anneissia japonica]|uniref:uncharacterized protein LOC117110158 n=1 Tax=Anneissia japonica TaxID=1529436 RepID=UPI0014254FCB|nr:uncharacterized protein LOC117110158 [Anneissia japonica]
MKGIEGIIGEMVWNQVKHRINLDQFGCSQGVSTTDALISLLNEFFSATDQGDEMRLRLLDFKKAYDLIDHNILINKLFKLGIDGNLKSWIYAFLLERKQRVMLGNVVSP